MDGKLFMQYKVAELETQGKMLFKLGVWEKKIVLYFPIDADVAVKDFYVNSSCRAVKKGNKVLFIGDSITQGYGAFESGKTFVNVANRILMNF